ncbi:MAG TPA: hypothetical protein CFH81_07925 [Sulfurovum sp. UBA12169]|nr:MAG TPA: hypothetical protein CFH81_07925 [Sulfurovum sp. UBA12169]
MGLMKSLAAASILLLTDLTAATISGNVYCDLNENGMQDSGEVCTTEAVWVKLLYPSGKIEVTQPAHPSGEFSFNLQNYTGTFTLFVDNNTDLKDAEPTPPANMKFGIPATGSYENIVIEDPDDVIEPKSFGLVPDPACDCDSRDGNMTISAISIDGDMSDWAGVLPDADNGSCDSGCQGDYDINKTITGEIQSTGRNIVRFSWTGEEDSDGYVYGYTQRVGSTSNTQTFLFYKDGDADGLMESGDIALVAGWQGNTGTVEMEICDYVPADAAGDPMVWQDSDVGTPLLYPGGTTVPESWVGSADGYTIAGGLTNCRTSPDLIGKGSADGAQMEWRVKWSTVGMSPFERITYHISTTNAEINDNVPPDQIDDNMGNCPLMAAPIIDLDINKTVSDSTPAIGSEITYTVTVTNNGDSTSGVVVNDTLPEGVTYEGFRGEDWDCEYNATSRTLSCAYESLFAGGASSSFDVFAFVENDPNLVGDTLANNACVNSDDNMTLNECDEATIIPRSPDAGIWIHKTVSDARPSEGDTIVYTINIANNGADTATDINVTDMLPSGTVYVSSSASAGSYDSTTHVWSIPTLAGGAEAELNITATISADQAGNTISNEACAVSDQNSTPVCDDVNLTVRQAILEIEKVASTPFPAEGDSVIYAITLTNTGDGNATDINITDELPDGVAYNDYNGTDWTCSGDPLSCTYSGILEPGDSATVEINVTIVAGVAGETITNTACIEGTEICDDENITVLDDLDLSVTKEVNNTTPTEGETIKYTITVTNHGPIVATGVEISEDTYLIDAIASDLQFDPQTGSMDGDETWNVGNLDVNETATLYVTATINTGTAGETYTNRVGLTALDQHDTNLTNNYAEATIAISALSQTAHIGDYVWYDDNYNGIQDAEEEGVEGLTVTLLDANGTVVATMLTDANGSYGFDVEPGIYSIRFSGLPENYIFTKTNMGSDDAVDSDADSGGMISSVSVESGEVDNTLDTGIYCTCYDVKSDGSPALNHISAGLMILITLMLGLFFVRREELNQR